MTPAEYVEEIVLPTVREFLAKPADRRLAYIAAQVTYHVVDYLMRTSIPIGAKRPIRDAETRRIEDLIRNACPECFAVVEGMCHGTKHCGRDGRGGHQFTPGDEKYVPAFGYGVGQAGYGRGRWGGSGLMVLLTSSQRVFVDTALRHFISAAVDEFPAELSSIDLTGIRPLT